MWIVARLAEGLDHAHSRGLLHRDLKPANILLAADGTPMLLDFNLAAESQPESPDGEVGPRPRRRHASLHGPRTPGCVQPPRHDPSRRRRRARRHLRAGPDPLRDARRRAPLPGPRIAARDLAQRADPADDRGPAPTAVAQGPLSRRPLEPRRPDRQVPGIRARSPICPRPRPRRGPAAVPRRPADEVRPGAERARARRQVLPAPPGPVQLDLDRADLVGADPRPGDGGGVRIYGDAGPGGAVPAPGIRARLRRGAVPAQYGRTRTIVTSPRAW